jgi:hypothetical protein
MVAEDLSDGANQQQPAMLTAKPCQPHTASSTYMQMEISTGMLSNQGMVVHSGSGGSSPSKQPDKLNPVVDKRYCAFIHSTKQQVNK